MLTNYAYYHQRSHVRHQQEHEDIHLSQNDKSCGSSSDADQHKILIVTNSLKDMDHRRYSVATSYVQCKILISSWHGLEPETAGVSGKCIGLRMFPGKIMCLHLFSMAV